MFPFKGWAERDRGGDIWNRPCGRTPVDNVAESFLMGSRMRNSLAKLRAR
jgi:hypothetical protein